MVLRRLGAAEGRADYFDRAIIEYTAAAFHFEQAGHERYCGNAENNLAMLLNRMGRYAEAHQHLDSAQRIFTRLGDAGSVAQVRETRARVYLAEGKHEKAADAIKSAVGALEQAGRVGVTGGRALGTGDDRSEAGASLSFASDFPKGYQGRGAGRGFRERGRGRLVTVRGARRVAALGE